jgi:DNA-binding ferritin-like protein (Dps family)
MKIIVKHAVLGMVLSTALSANAQIVATPAISSGSAFAIVTDQKTYDHDRKALTAYKNAVEKDGLATYILAANWSGPEEIRKELIKLYHKTPKLEGAVLVGDIPVAMIRDAQYLTSAFKMDQRRNWQSSSVPSDRYYDDFGLQFTFLKRDSIRPNYFYYSLKSSSRQYISMDIYTARIKPPKKAGEDWYKAIEDYLWKAVAAKEEKNNKLDNAFVYTGYGYNSESLNSWGGEQIALREQFPSLFKPGGYMKFMNFRMATNMKVPLLSEIQREDLDMAVFHDHGEPDQQMISGYPSATNPSPSIDNLRRYLRSKVAAAKRHKQDINSTKESFVKSLGVPIAWMEDTFADSVVLADSVFDANLSISIDDVAKITPNARFIYVDGCLTGSFQLDDYLAAYYPFGKGKTIVTMANSVGVLQDLWPDELLGLHQFGVRTGNWFKHIAYLESHLLGDPTFHFKKEGSNIPDLNEMIVNQSTNVAAWEKLLGNKSPDIQTLAMVHIFRIRLGKSSGLLKEKYFNGESYVVRLEAYKLLEKLNNADFYEVLKAAIKDPYEMIRRQAAYSIGDIGSNEFVDPLLELMFTDSHSRRVTSRVTDAATQMNSDEMINRVQKLSANYSYALNEHQVTDKINKDQNYIKFKINRDLKVILDKTQPQKERLFNIKALRNYNYHSVVPQVIIVALDKSEVKEVRLAAIEALSWFQHSYQRQKIVEMCDTLSKSTTEDKEIIDQAVRAKNIFMTFR